MENQELKRAGLKITTPRVKILEILGSRGQHHLSAEDIYRKLLEAGEDVGLATVYRVLTQFESAGLVTRHNFEAGTAVFEITGDDHHDHLVCVKCSKVEEFCDPIIEDRLNEIAIDANYQVTYHAFNIYGLCKECS